MKRLIALLLIISLIITPAFGVYATQATSTPGTDLEPGDIVSIKVRGNDWSNPANLSYFVVVQPTNNDGYVTVMFLGAVSNSAWWQSGGAITNIAQGQLDGSLMIPLLGRMQGGQLEPGTLVQPWDNINRAYLPRLLNLADLRAFGLVPQNATSLSASIDVDSTQSASTLMPPRILLPGNLTSNYWTMICQGGTLPTGECQETTDFQSQLYMMVVEYNPANNPTTPNPNIPLFTIRPRPISLLDPSTGNPRPGNQTSQFSVRPVVQFHEDYIACRNQAPTCPPGCDGVPEGTPGCEGAPPHCLRPPCPENCPEGTLRNPPETDNCPEHCLVDPPTDVPTNEVLFPLVLIGALALAGIAFKLISKKSVFDRI